MSCIAAHTHPAIKSFFLHHANMLSETSSHPEQNQSCLNLTAWLLFFFFYIIMINPASITHQHTLSTLLFLPRWLQSSMTPSFTWRRKCSSKNQVLSKKKKQLTVAVSFPDLSNECLCCLSLDVSQVSTPRPKSRVSLTVFSLCCSGECSCRACVHSCTVNKI